MDEDKAFKKTVSITNDVMAEFMRTQCHTIIKNTFYKKYGGTKVLPLYEKKIIVRVKN